MTIAPASPARPSGDAGDEEDQPVRRRRPRWYLEVLAIVWLCWVYDLTTNLAPIRQKAAVAHGKSILHLESVLHLDPERSLDHWLVGHHTLALWMSDYYDNAHFIVTLGLVGWLWWRHADHYRSLRTSLVLSNVLAFIVFWFYPTAPPRMLPGRHIADVVAASGAFGSWHSGSLAHHANELAAMPSLHLAWAAWSSLAAWTIWRHKSRWVALVWLYPVLTGVAVLSTGNHYLADVVAGLLTLAASCGLTALWQRYLRRRRQSSGRIESMTSSTVTAPTKRSASSHTATLTRS